MIEKYIRGHVINLNLGEWQIAYPIYQYYSRAYVALIYKSLLYNERVNSNRTNTT